MKKSVITLALFLLTLTTALASQCSFTNYNGDYAEASWWTMDDTDLDGNTVIDVCGHQNMTNHGATTGVIGMFAEALDFEVGDAPDDHLTGTDDDFYTPADNFSIGCWIKPESIGINQVIMGKWEHGVPDKEWYLYTATTNKMDFWAFEDSTVEYRAARSNTQVAAGNWYLIVGVFYTLNNTAQIWVNATYESSNDFSVGAAVNVENTIQEPWIGARDNGGVQLGWDGLLDECWYLNTSLNATAINEIFVNNTFTEAATENVGCNITTNDYNITNSTAANWTTQNGSAARPLTVNYTATCYDGNFTCAFIRDGAHAGDNQTALANGTFNYIQTNTTWADGTYEANVTCWNGVHENSSSNTSLSVDATPPDINITHPLNATYPTGLNVTLNFTWTETNQTSCYYSLNASANTTIGYVNSTNLTDDQGIYHVRLWCNDSAGNTGRDSENFTLNIAPTIPVLWLPLNTTILDQTPIALHWNTSTDADGDPITYWLQVDNNSNFASPEQNESTTLTWNVSNSFANDVWWWRVLAGDGTTNSTWSNPYNFNETAWGGGAPGGGTSNATACNPCLCAAMYYSRRHR